MTNSQWWSLAGYSKHEAQRRQTLGHQCGARHYRHQQERWRWWPQSTSWSDFRHRLNDFLIYTGAEPCWQLQTRTHNLYVIRSDRCSQCKSFSNDETWSYLRSRHWWRTAVSQDHVSEGPLVQHYSSPPTLTGWTPPSVLSTKTKRAASPANCASDLLPIITDTTKRVWLLIHLREGCMTPFEKEYNPSHPSFPLFPPSHTLPASPSLLSFPSLSHSQTDPLKHR